MNNTDHIPVRKRHGSLTARILFVFTALLCTLCISSCFGPRDPRLPEKYYGTSWKCTDPYAFFDVNDKGSCVGTLVFKDVTLSIEVVFLENRSGRSGRTQFYVHDGGPAYILFDGSFEVNGDVMVISGKWSEFMETIYHQTYDSGECTLVFERQQ